MPVTMQATRRTTPLIVLFVLSLALSPVRAAPNLPRQPVRPSPAAVPQTTYGVINLGPVANCAVINSRNQAAYCYPTPGGNAAVFYDGRRMWPIGSLGGNSTDVSAINDRGEVTGASTIELPPDAPDWVDYRRGFRWSSAAGIRPLPGPSPRFDGVSHGTGINVHGQIAGYAEVEGPYGPVHAARWSMRNAYVDLGGGNGFRGAIANAINDVGDIVGYYDDAHDIARATLWQPSGKAIDLGTLGYSSYAARINRRGDVIGHAMVPSDNEAYRGFFWSRETGITAISTPDGGRATAHVLNNRGEAAGFAETADGWPRAMVWSRPTGMIDLHDDAYRASGVAGINDRGDLVGWVAGRAGTDDYVARAVRFVAHHGPIDLTSHLADAPATLALTEALAVSADGTILANSNAGLVMLQPGGRGSDAPLLGPVEMPAIVAIGTPIAVSVALRDRNTAQTHQGQVNWGDATEDSAAQVEQGAGAATLTGKHVYKVPGSYFVTVKVTDSGGEHSSVRGEVHVVDPAAPWTSGQGTIMGVQSAAPSHGRIAAMGALRFNFLAAATTPAPGARSVFAGTVRLDGALRFQSDTLTQVSASQGTVHLTASGRLNGKPGYRIVIDAVDGAGDAAKDTLRVRIMHVGGSMGAEVVDYDNGRDAAIRPGQTAGARLPATALSEGDIVIGR